jgi:hypothetical protein
MRKQRIGLGMCVSGPRRRNRTPAATTISAAATTATAAAAAVTAVRSVRTGCPATTTSTCFAHPQRNANDARHHRHGQDEQANPRRRGAIQPGEESFEKRTTRRQPNEDRCDDHSQRPRPRPAGRRSRSRMRFSRSSSISESSHPAIRCSPGSTSEVARDQRDRHGPGTRESRADRQRGPTN